MIQIMDTEQLQTLLLFASKSAIFTVAFILCVAIPVIIIKKFNPSKKQKKLKIKDLKKQYKKHISSFKSETLNKKDFKNYMKSLKKEKNSKSLPTCFVLHFEGDKLASQVESLREEVSLVINVARPKDQVVLLLDSPGGGVSHYGLAADQLQRLRNKNISLTVCVDKVAGSTLR